MSAIMMKYEVKVKISNCIYDQVRECSGHPGLCQQLNTDRLFYIIVLLACFFFHCFTCLFFLLYYFFT